MNTRTKCRVSGSCEGSPSELYTVTATTEEGRRFWYCHPDGKPRNGIYIRELTESEYVRLLDGVRCAGGINTSLPCWSEGEPVYGSLAYELSGAEQLWARREREEAAWN